MTEEEYLRNSKIANIVYDYIKRGIGCDYDIFNSPPPPIPIRPVKVKTLKEKLEDNKMKATSVQNIKNVKNISFSIEGHPFEMESKLTIVASTNDDIFEFEFEGPDLLEICRAAGLFTGWEKDQKIRELEEKIRELEKDNKNLGDRAMIHGIIYTTDQLIDRILELEALKMPTIENFADEEPVDNVNHPSHYTGRYECIDVMQDVFGDEATDNFCLCNAFKYIWRARKKNGLEDVKKAVWYLNKYIEEAEKRWDLKKETNGDSSQDTN